MIQHVLNTLNPPNSHDRHLTCIVYLIDSPQGYGLDGWPRKPTGHTTQIGPQAVSLQSQPLVGIDQRQRICAGLLHRLRDLADSIRIRSQFDHQQSRPRLPYYCHRGTTLQWIGSNAHASRVNLRTGYVELQSDALRPISAHTIIHGSPQHGCPFIILYWRETTNVEYDRAWQIRQLGQFGGNECIQTRVG